MPRCLQLIAVSWFTFFLLICVAFGTQSLLEIPSLREWSGCHEMTCRASVDRVINGFIVAIYLITLTCYAFTVVYIWRASKTTKALQSASQRGKNKGRKKGPLARRGGFGIPLLKLSLNVATFAFFHLPHTLAALFVAASPAKFKFWTLICFAHTNFHAMQLTMGLIGICLMLRIVCDTLIGHWVDREVRRSMLHNMCCCVRRKKVFPSQYSTRSNINNTELTRVSLG